MNRIAHNPSARRPRRLGRPGRGALAPAGLTAASGRQCAAFTLIELLVVIAVIALLVGILVPVVGLVHIGPVGCRTRARMAELGMACESYRHECGAYPGQEYPNELAGNGGAFTASQWLSRALFTDPAGTSAETIYPQPKLAPLRDDEDLIGPYAPHGGTGTYSTIQYGVPSDRTSRPMPILYYAARPGATGMDQYKFQDNAPHTPGASEAAFRSFIADPSVAGGAQPASAGAFLLISAGPDRVFFTGDDGKYPQW